MTKDRLSEIRLKVERAIKHIDDLAAVCKAFINSTPYTLDRETEPKTGYYHFSVTNVQAPTARSRIDRRRCYSQPSQRVGSSRVSKKAANVPRPSDYFCGGFL